MKKTNLFYLTMLICYINFSLRAQIAANSDSIRPILVGQTIPFMQLTDAEGKIIDTKELFSQKNTVLIFYRGGWCPYCNVHLRELGELEASLISQGYQIVAVSPDAPQKLKNTIDKEKVNYTLLSDNKTELIQKMGIAFYGPDKYKKLFSDASDGGHDKGVLPVPSVFFVDKQGKVAFSYIDPNYKVRLSGKLVNAIASNLDFGK
jgi:peroxiredoxin